LLRQNRRRFGVHNMTPVPGSAPEALARLPAPDAVFIGGSGGALAAIAAAAREKNPAARLVVAAVTLETLSRAMDVFGDAAPPEVVQIAVTRTVRRGSHTMLDAQNPVFLISGGGHA
jgi:precorrin-6Y C5,15-methyltransferase (decarboxylating)